MGLLPSPQLSLESRVLSDSSEPISQGHVSWHATSEDSIHLYAMPAPAHTQCLRTPYPVPQLIEEICVGLGGVQDIVGEIIDKLVKPRWIFQQAGYGIKPPKGVLLYGPPGTGKTLLAQRIASKLIGKEKYRHFFNAAEIVSEYPQASTEQIKDIFDPAIQDFRRLGKNANTHIFIFDEIDAMLGPTSKWQAATPTQEAIRSLLQTIMSGAEEYSNIIIFGTTNQELERFNPALLRADRFSIKILVPLPDYRTRREMLSLFFHEIERQGWACNRCDISELSKQACGLSHSDIKETFDRAVSVSTNEYLAAQLNACYNPEIVIPPYKTLTNSHFQTVLHNPENAAISKTCALEKFSLNHPFVTLSDQKSAVLEPVLHALNTILSTSGRFGVILIQGAMNTGKSAICHEVVKRVHGFDRYEVIRNGLEEKLKKAFEAANQPGNTLLVVDPIDTFLESGELFSNPKKLFAGWHTLVDNIAGKSVAMIMTSALSAPEIFDATRLKGGIREYITLQNTLSEEMIKELLASQMIEPTDMKKILDLFSDSCAIKELLTLLDHYRLPMLEAGKISWDFTQMGKDFKRNHFALMKNELDYYA